MKLEGTVSIFPLRELIDMISYSSVTGVLNIYASQCSGHLYFRDGHLYHVDAGGIEGVKALGLIMEQADASFAFVSDPTIDRETLWGDHEPHVRQAERLAVRWQRIRPRIAHLGLIPALNVTLEQIEQRVNPAHMTLISTIDGQQSLADLAQHLGWAEIEVAEVVMNLLDEQLVRLSEVPQAGNRMAATTRPDEPNNPQGGLFDKFRRNVRQPLATAEPEAAQQPPLGDELILRLLRG